MNATPPAGTAAPSPGRDLVAAARYYLGGRRGLLLLAAVAVVGGLVSSWSWLVAAGIAPILLAVAPCIAMCALGLCMRRAGVSSCATRESAPDEERSPASGSPAGGSGIPKRRTIDWKPEA